MFLLTSHFVSLLVQLLDDHLFGADVSLQFFNLIVQDKFELLQLLNLLLKLANLHFFLLNRRQASPVLLFTGCDFTLDLLLLLHCGV